MAILFPSCGNSHEKPVSEKKTVAQKPLPAAQPATTGTGVPKNDSFRGPGEVPILCYHQIRDYTPKDSKSAKVYIVPVANFREQIAMLHDSGYHAISPDQLLAYKTQGKALPSRPVMITFDDGDSSQISNGMPEMDKAGYKGVFFVMTVVLNRPGYFSRQRVKDLAAQGHVIGCHTWDHHMVTKYTDPDWIKQVEKPRALLAELSGAPVRYFAYPFGLWNHTAAARLSKYVFTAAFSLTGKADPEYPLFSINRQIIDGGWSLKRFNAYLRSKEHGAAAKPTAAP
jgi:peptidoglycan/xylan/chitin deacetylase (PgdA/CDA1 family)